MFDLEGVVMMMINVGNFSKAFSRCPIYLSDNGMGYGSNS